MVSLSPQKDSKGVNRGEYVPISTDDSFNGYHRCDKIAFSNEPLITVNVKIYAKFFFVFLMSFSLVGLLWLTLFSTPKLKASLIRTTAFRAVNHPEPPSPFWGVVTKPYPTGAFWTNLAVRNGDNPVAVLPYGVKTLDNGIQISYGATRRQVSQLAITDPFVADLQISATQAYITRSIEAYDNISVTMTYKTALNGKYKTHLVKGSPFVTVVYENATPIISSALMKILLVESRVVKGSSGTQYIVTLGNFQKWFVYCSEPVALSWKEDSLVSQTPIRGFVRVAILPLLNLENAFNMLVSYVQKYPTGANLQIIHPSNILSQLIFTFNTVGAGSLLMLALPHQYSIMTAQFVNSTEARTALASLSPIYSIKGKLKPVIGDVWRLSYNIPQIGWNYALTETISLNRLDEIGKSLMFDVRAVLPNAMDVYTFGKQLSRLARLAVLADALGIGDVRQQALALVQSAITPWIVGSNADALLYDRTYGGVITAGGLADANSDYGSAYYNDHHFHYGYLIYASAVIARYDPVFFDVYRASFDTIVRDVCNPESNDPDFPFARHKDFFDGHSWASGLFPQANGKGQESSSEAANAYYACYLYGLATGNPTLMQFAHTLLSMEVQSAQTYWHMGTSEIYDPIFATQRMVGNIGGLDVSASTWFGSQPEYVHGINIMPLTPVTSLLFDQQFVQKQWPVLGSRLPPAPPSQPADCSARPGCAFLGLQGLCCPNNEGVSLACCGNSNQQGMADEWKSFIYAVHAVVNRDAAWSEIMKLESFGSGGSKANSLLWAASRPPPLLGYNYSVQKPDLQGSIKPMCSCNSACDAIGLVGKCCPSDNPPGVYLGCCPQIVP